MNRLKAILELLGDRARTVAEWVGGLILLTGALRAAWLYPEWSAAAAFVIAPLAGLVILIRRRGPLPYQYALWRHARILDVTKSWIERRESELKRSMRSVLRDMQKGFYTWDTWVPVRDAFVARELMPLLTADEQTAMNAQGSRIRAIVNGRIDGEVLERCERDGPLELRR